MFPALWSLLLLPLLLLPVHATAIFFCQNVLSCRVSCLFCCVCVVQRFLGQPEIPVETAVRVYRRYLQLEPTHAEEFIAYLKAKVREEHTHREGKDEHRAAGLQPALRGLHCPGAAGQPTAGGGAHCSSAIHFTACLSIPVKSNWAVTCAVSPTLQPHRCDPFSTPFYHQPCTKNSHYLSG